MKVRDAVVWEEQRRRLAARLDRDNLPADCSRPVIAGSNIRYEISERIEAMPCGGIGLIHEMVRSIKLAESIDERVHVFKRHFPYHESDHVLNLAYNVLCGGTRLEDLERLRSNEAYLNTLGCDRVPDPTTAGDFLRRFDQDQVMALMEATNAARVKVWKKLSKKERALALIDVDGTIAPTTGECKEGMDISYKGEWRYAPVVVTLANTQEVLFIKNRSAPSHSGAVAYMEAAVELQHLFDQIRYLFYITNVRDDALTPSEVVYEANDRILPPSLTRNHSRSPSTSTHAGSSLPRAS